ncbi:MAG: hypothetical protein U0572_00320 [Phycisphaerales bacterium]
MRCKTCGHILSAAREQRCAECGREFNRADASTFSPDPALQPPPNLLPTLGVAFCASFVALLLAALVSLALPQALQPYVGLLVLGAVVVAQAVFAWRCGSVVRAAACAAGIALGLTASFVIGSWLVSQAITRPAWWVLWSPVTVFAALALLSLPAALVGRRISSGAASRGRSPQPSA